MPEKERGAKKVDRKESLTKSLNPAQPSLRLRKLDRSLDVRACVVNRRLRRALTLMLGNSLGDALGLRLSLDSAACAVAAAV